MERIKCATGNIEEGEILRGEHNSLLILDKIISVDTIVNIRDFEVLRMEVIRHDAIQTRPFGKITEVSSFTRFRIECVRAIPLASGVKTWTPRSLVLQ